MKNNLNNLTALTTSNVQEFIGKRINFFCEQYSANANIDKKVSMTEYFKNATKEQLQKDL